MRIRTSSSIAALAGAAMFALSLSPASAFTLSGPSLEQPVASAHVQKVWWRGGYHAWRGGYHAWRGGYGYRHTGWGYGARRWHA
jgi:hypothetical protein